MDPARHGSGQGVAGAQLGGPPAPINTGINTQKHTQLLAEGGRCWEIRSLASVGQKHFDPSLTPSTKISSTQLTDFHVNIEG